MIIQNLPMWRGLQLELNVQAHIYDASDNPIATLAHYHHHYNKNNLELMLNGAADRRKPELAIIICNNVVIGRLYLNNLFYGPASRTWTLELDLGDGVKNARPEPMED